MILFSVLEHSSDFIGENQFYHVILIEVDTFNAIFVVFFEEYPPNQHYVSIFLHIISVINIMGSEAGKVRYPMFIADGYMGYIALDRRW